MDAQNLDQINQILARLVGEKCFRPHFSYGQELRLEMGDRIPYKHPRMAHLEHGSWMLGTRASEWELTKLGRYADDQSPTLEEIIDVPIVVAQLNAEGLVLEITFSNALRLSVYPDQEAAADDICNWELFTADGHVLEVGPGDMWTYESTRSKGNGG